MRERGALVIDVDGTLCPVKDKDQRYEDLEPNRDVIARLCEWQRMGFRIVLHTARNMRTHEGNLGLINKHTAPVLLDWLARWGVPYDELHFGKPWAGEDGFYVDDRAVRPDEFLAHSPDELKALVETARARIGTAR